MASSTPQIKNYKKEIPGKLSDDSFSWCFPDIITKTKLGQTSHWKIIVRVIDKNTNKFIKIKDIFFENTQLPQNLAGWYKVEGFINDGKIRDTVPTFVLSGKNLKKNNSTNVFTQALRDSLSIYNKHLKKSTITVSDSVTLYSPMLAESTISILEFPLYLQRKYNGVRALAVKNNNKITLYSRQRNLYPALDYIKIELYDVLPDNLYLDGELYKHGMPLQEISGFVRNENSFSGEVEYVVYDCFIPNQQLNFIDRLNILKSLKPIKYIKIAETFEVHNQSELNQLYESFLSDGYEGAIIRFNRYYEYSDNKRRSKYLIKMKPVKDHEFAIVDFSESKKGKSAGALMITCETENGLQFQVTPTLEIIERKELLIKMREIESNGKTHFENNWLGKPLIVYFDSLSKDGIPLQPRTKMELRLHD